MTVYPDIVLKSPGQSFPVLQLPPDHQKHELKLHLFPSADVQPLQKPHHKLQDVYKRQQVVYVGNSSMEIVVIVEVEDLETEGKKRALTAFFTMIALDKKGRPTKVPELTLETEEEKRAFEEGRLRYERHKHKK